MESLFTIPISTSILNRATDRLLKMPPNSHLDQEKLTEEPTEGKLKYIKKVEELMEKIAYEKYKQLKRQVEKLERRQRERKEHRERSRGRSKLHHHERPKESPRSVPNVVAANNIYRDSREVHIVHSRITRSKTTTQPIT